MSETSPIATIHEELGARLGEVGGRTVPRNYGEPAAEYDAVRQGAGVADRADRVPLQVTGRDPVRMLQGLVSNDVAGAPPDRSVDAALLTPKGKMVAELRIVRQPDSELLLDVDAGALEGALLHFRKFVPPLFAKVQDASDRLRVIGVYGPESRAVVVRALGGELPDPAAPNEVIRRRFDADEVVVLRTDYVGEDGYDVFVPVRAAPALWRALTEAGARPVGHATLEVLRIEAGHPRWGAELDETVIPLEAGLRERAISTTKGCYTGQEVIIRILHRGHVNRHLRGLALGDAPATAVGAPLVRPADGKPVGRITSACYSPLHGQTIGLGYVRREIEPPAAVRLQETDGAEVMVYELPIPVGV